MSKPGWRKARIKRLVGVQRGICASCGGPMQVRRGQAEARHPTTDEVWPRSRGGMRVLGNQVAMHRACNEAKADRLPNGCEIIMLHLVNARLMSEPGFRWHWEQCDARQA